MSIDKSVNEILKGVGGPKNVNSLVHCYTRLRFTLKDDSIPDDKKIENIDGVMGVNRASGQYQIIIGNDVADYFKKLEPKLSQTGTSDDADANQNKGNLWDRFVKLITSAILPVIPAIIAGGLVKVLLSILNLTGLVTTNTVNYRIINAIGDAPFYFLPILVAFYCARHFKVNVPLAVGIVGVLLYPDFVSLLAKGNVHLFGIPVYSSTYSSSIIPSILIIFVMSYIEPLVDKVIPKMTKAFLEPLVELIIMAPLAIIILGPIGNILSVWLTSGIQFVYDKVGIVAVVLFAGFYALIVLTGLHQGFAPIILQNIATMGFDPFMMAACLASNISQGGAALAVALKTKNPKLKATALGAGISAIFGGVTEPALFGVNLRLKKPLYSAMLSAGITGIFIGIFKLKSYVVVSPGVLSLGMFIGGKGFANFIIAIISTIIALILSFVFTLLFWKEENVVAKDISTKNMTDEDQITVKGISETIASPLVGKFENLEDVPDVTFSKKLIGDGIAIEPTEGKVVAPFDGVVESLFPTGHAIGLKSNDGIELLIHLGLETVNLKGKYFEAHVKQDDVVKKGQVLITFDLDKIKAAGYNMISPVVITNMNEIKDIEVNKDLKEVDDETTVMIANA